MVEFAMNIDGVEMVKDINVEEFIESENKIAVIEAFDDVTGLNLDVDKLRKARREEIDYIESKGIWERVPVQRCWDKTGKAPTSGKWVDVQKGEGVRSRYVGRDFKRKARVPGQRSSRQCLRSRRRRLYSGGLLLRWVKLESKSYYL